MKLLKDNLLYLSTVCFLFVSTFAVSVTVKGPASRRVEVVNAQEKNFPAVPVLSDSADTFPIISAQSVLAFDVDSGVTLYEKDPDKAVLPASTTKIVTALVAMDYYPNDRVITVGKVRVDGQKMGLIEGEKITVGDLLEGLLVYSANDAAEVLAANYCIEGTVCGREYFVSAMNKKAADMGLTNTHFNNPTGLDEVAHYSTARDLVVIAAEAMKNPEFARIVATEEITVTSTDKQVIHRLTNINELLGKVEGVQGVKTGWTEAARENLVSYTDRTGHKIMMALLGSQDRFGESEELIEWMYSNYSWQSVVYKYPRN